MKFSGSDAPHWSNCAARLRSTRRLSAIERLEDRRLLSVAVGDFFSRGGPPKHLDLVVEIAGNLAIRQGNDDGTFADPLPIPNVAGVTALAAGDFNGDGLADLAVATTTGLEVLPGRGDGTFADPLPIPNVAGVTALAAGDFNGDGLADLAVATTTGLEVLPGRRDGTFAPAIQVAGVTGVTALAAGDFTGQTGHRPTDLAVATTTGLMVLPGQRARAFGAPLPYFPATPGKGSPTFAALPGVTMLAAGDFNGDDRTDLVAGSLTGIVGILWNPGSGTFSKPKAVPELAGVLGLGAGDFRGQGMTDLIVSTESRLFRLPGAKGQPFGRDSVLNNLAQVTALAVGDFNGDGVPDLAVGTQLGLDVQLGTGDGTFAPAIQVAGVTGVTALAAGDFTGQTGHRPTDLAVATTTGLEILSGLKFPPVGKGGGIVTPTSVRTISLPQGVTALASGDFTGGGHTDLVVTNGSDLELLRGAKDGLALAPLSSAHVSGIITALATVGSSRNSPTSLAVGTPSGLELLLVHGDGTFVLSMTVPGVTNVKALAAGNFVGNSGLDLALRTGSRLELLLPGQGEAFSKPIPKPIPVVAGLAQALAVYPSGPPSDLIVGTKRRVKLLSSKGGGRFRTPAPISSVGGIRAITVVPPPGPSALVPGSIPGLIVGTNAGLESHQFLNDDPTPIEIGTRVTAMLSGDFTGDGYTDLVVGTTAGLLLLHPDKTSSTYQDQIPRLIRGLGTRGITALAAGDFNHDGRTDLAVGTATGLSILMGKGKGTFAAPLTVETVTGVTALAAGDFTGQGHTDLVVATATGLELLSSISIGTVGISETLQQVPNLAGVTALAAGDFNHDGSTDLAVGTASGLEVLLGNGHGSFVAPMPVAGAPGVPAIFSGDLNSDGHLDLLIGTKFGNELFLGKGDGTFIPADESPPVVATLSPPPFAAALGGFDFASTPLGLGAGAVPADAPSGPPRRLVSMSIAFVATGGAGGVEGQESGADMRANLLGRLFSQPAALDLGPPEVSIPPGLSRDLLGLNPLEFHAGSEGIEAAVLLNFNLVDHGGGDGGTLPGTSAGARIETIARLQPLGSQGLPLVPTLQVSSVGGATENETPPGFRPTSLVVPRAADVPAGNSRGWLPFEVDERGLLDGLRGLLRADPGGPAAAFAVPLMAKFLSRTLGDGLRPHGRRTRPRRSPPGPPAPS